MPLGMEVGLSPGDFVLDGDPASPPLRGHSPQFLSYVRCGQTTGWMKTPLGTEVDLGPGHTVLDGKGAQQPPIFTFLSHSHHCKALISLICADVPLRNYSITHSTFCVACHIFVAIA